MWLRNYYNMLTAALLGDITTISTSTPSDYTPPIRVRLADGSYATTPYEDGGANTEYNSHSVQWLLNLGKAGLTLTTSNPTTYTAPKCLIGFGSSSTPVSYDDYKLGSIVSPGSLVSGYGSLTKQSTFDAVTHKYESERMFTITNPNTSPVTLREMGLWVPGKEASSNYIYMALVYREVFDEDITLEQGESLLVSFKRSGLVFNYTPY